MLVMKKEIIGNKSKSLEMCMKVNNEEGNVRNFVRNVYEG